MITISLLSSISSLHPASYSRMTTPYFIRQDFKNEIMVLLLLKAKFKVGS